MFSNQFIWDKLGIYLITSSKTLIHTMHSLIITYVHVLSITTNLIDPVFKLHVRLVSFSWFSSSMIMYFIHHHYQFVDLRIIKKMGKK